MKVFFAPDYRKGVPYQALLADALAAEGVEVTFPAGHRRLLPLFRGLQGWSGDLLHIHWPEKFFEVRRDGLDPWRKVRYPLDLALASRRLPILLTAHDLRPHNRAGERLIHANFRLTYALARAIVVHSAKSLDLVCETYRVSPAKVHVIPHGDLSPSLGPLPTRAEARHALGLSPGQPLCLMFGTVEPYKGIEPVLDWWRKNNPPATLALVGKPFTPAYGAEIAARAGSSSNIRLELGWQPDDALKQWLAAADCVLFHYRAIFTSGAACLARSLGLPILLPHRLDTIDLAEPHPLVLRFTDLETDFPSALARALATPPSFEAAVPWRTTTAWPEIAAQTAKLYRTLIT